MPEISSFRGIKISMNWSDHVPPHFHASYNDFEASIGIYECAAIVGALPRKEMILVLAWCARYQAELVEDWERAQKHEPLLPIPPLA